MKRKWKTVCNESGNDEVRRTLRLKVPGGHLYRYQLDTPCSDNGRRIENSLVFVPAGAGRSPTRR
jgi:hypothetical protein